MGGRVLGLARALVRAALVLALLPKCNGDDSAPVGSGNPGGKGGAGGSDATADSSTPDAGEADSSVGGTSGIGGTSGTSGAGGVPDAATDGANDAGASPDGDAQSPNDGSNTDGSGSVCGNGVLEAGEACDDGNTTPSDGCAINCSVDPGYSCTSPNPGPTPPASRCEPCGPIYVNELASAQQPNGRSWTTGYRDVSAAISRGAQLVSSGCSSVELWVAKGTYYPGVPPNRSQSFALASRVAVYGGFAGTETARSQRDPKTNESILSGDLNRDDATASGNVRDNAYHVVTANNVDNGAVLDGFTIRAGNADGAFPDSNGGGLLLRDSSPTLQNLIIELNRARDGGGIFAERGVPALRNSTVRNNFADRGGGAYCSNSPIAIRETMFISNTWSALYADRSNLQIDDSSFLYNQGTRGGALALVSAKPRIAKTTFNGNSSIAGSGIATSGGAAYIEGGEVTFDGCTFEQNSSLHDGTTLGGALHVSGGTLTVKKSILTQNGAQAPRAYGGAIAAESSSVTIVSSRMSGNGIRTLSGLSSGEGPAFYAVASRSVIANSWIVNDQIVSASARQNAVVSAGAAPVNLTIVNSLVSGGITTASDPGVGTITNSTLWSQTGLGAGSFPESTGSITVSYSCVRNGGFDESAPGETNRDDCVDIGVPPAVGTPQRNRGNTAALPMDTADLDGDGDTTERLPLDLDGKPRVVESAVDIGPWEGS